jgi:hypothetical protein
MGQGISNELIVRPLVTVSIHSVELVTARVVLGISSGGIKVVPNIRSPVSQVSVLSAMRRSSEVISISFLAQQ